MKKFLKSHFIHVSFSKRHLDAIFDVIFFSIELGPRLPVKDQEGGTKLVHEMSELVALSGADNPPDT